MSKDRKENQGHANNQLVKSMCACVSIFIFINNVHTRTILHLCFVGVFIVLDFKLSFQL